MMSLVPADSLTQRLLVDVLTAMYKHDIATKRAAATSEFPRPNVATAEAQSVETDTQADSTTVTVSGQNNDKELLQLNLDKGCSL